MAAGVVLAALFPLMSVASEPDPGWATWSFGVALTSCAFLFVRRQRDIADRLRAAQAVLAERARTDERHRIAREMHDLVGHGLTVALLHIGSARLALDDDPDSARASLSEAERAARESLEDVRAAVGLMRTSDASTTAPTPTAADIDGLVASYRAAGAAITLDLRGPLETLTSGRGLAVYRIVQESLTNAIRHGDGGPIAVQVEVADGRARVSVRNPRTARAQGGSGTGIAAMTERATALGGRLSAGPDALHWRVEAVIPA